MDHAVYASLLIIHLLAATIWVGGHLTLALTVLPRALKARSAKLLLDFEQGYERIGIPALIIQVITGIWLAHIRLGPPTAWFADNPLARVVQIKLGLLLLTVVFALHARLVLIPKLTDDNLNTLAWHIRPVTLIAVLMAVAGVLFRTGGIG